MKTQPKLQRKMTYNMKWSVHPHRKDQRTGVISPVPMSTYTKYAFEEIERQFRG
ncbi:hypothetical protein [Peribacillus muralis]|uniref:hypothetical protein n=1 Tax=Peribacillus muralis TaxID=264697 RepID=UPI003D047BD4